MFYTARQLEALHDGNGKDGHANGSAGGQVVLPYGARLSPLAADWVKAKRLSIGYSNVEAPTLNGRNGHQAGQAKPQAAAPVATGPTEGTVGSATSAAGAAAKSLLWWCDGPCGAAKAAVTAVAKEAGLAAADLPSQTPIAPAIKQLAAKVKAGEAGVGVLMVQTGAAAVIFANRCPSLRAVLATSLEAVEAGVRHLAANVLVIEYPRLSLQQVKNLLSRFVRNRPTLSEDVRRQLQELASCG